ncbi:MAG: endonuclease, partial [Gammaproteobacteria bacterium]|nr:endonuclease [Gammaproteobacteria bacterium]
EKLTTISALQQRQWQQGSVLQWANESLKQTQKIYQNYRPGMLLDEAAISRDSPVIELRIEQAAVRLAHLLELYLAQDAS